MEKQTRFSALHNIKEDKEVVDDMLNETKVDAQDRSESYGKLITPKK
ncbi:hypothetical protein QWY90_01480 [Flavobacterium paronense]|nr:hypothetical protein [Flavobacterium paronense]MDN3675980.1 hypothetical protein [Flavobacterium paronense]